jgi:heme-degrading monooxygenase HmoA
MPPAITEVRAMYVFVRHYRGSGDLDEIMRRVARGIVPLLNGMPGFRGYWACQTADGEAFSITLFADSATAIAGNAAVREHVAHKFADLLPEAPDIHAGPVQIALRGEAMGDDGFASVSLRRGLPFQAVLTPRLNEVLVPALRAMPGFRGYLAARNEGELSSGIGVTLWNTPADGELGLVKTGQLIAERLADVVSNPVARISGEVHVAANHWT